MKTIRQFLFLLLLVCSLATAKDFIRDLPSSDMSKLVTRDKFHDCDAVIFLKEQSSLVKYDNIYVRGQELFGPSTSYSKIIIVKVFNERAILRYGTFEFEYVEKFGNELKNEFTVMARVLKPDGNIITVSEDDIKTIVSRTSKRGEPMARKVLFKIPNLAPDDIIQIEYQYTDILTFSTSGIFYYNDVDPVLFSNLYITLPLTSVFKIYSFPETQVGAPKTEQVSNTFDAGETYFWSKKNLGQIPDEPFSRPFEETSLLTSFVVYDKYKEDDDKKHWNSLAKKFYRDYIDKGSIRNAEYKQLGLKEITNSDSVDFEKINRLYSSIKNNFLLADFNSLYPLNEDIDKIFEAGEGDASDLSLIMYKILEKWNQKVNMVWIRDKREGIFEKNIPSTKWFDRLGVMVNIKGQEMIYDFDQSAPSLKYKMPWFLNNINVLVIEEESCYEKKLSFASTADDNFIHEIHKLKLNTGPEVSDSVEIVYTGSSAEKLRDELYGQELAKVKDDFKKKFNRTTFSDISSLSINDYLNEQEIKINIYGKPVSKLEEVDSFLVFRLNNQVIREFKESITTILRRVDFYFDNPFSFKVEWLVRLPEDYKLNEILPNKTINCLGKAYSIIEFQNQRGAFKLSVETKFNEQVFSAKNYSDIINFLDRTLRVFEKNIVLSKI